MRIFANVLGLFTALALTGCSQDDQGPPREIIRPVLSQIVEPHAHSAQGFAGTIEPEFSAELSFRLLGRLVARDVGVELIDSLHYLRRPCGAVDRTVVGVGDHHHPQPVEVRAESLEVNVLLDDTGHLHRLVVPPHQQRNHDDHDRARDKPGAERILDPRDGQRRAEKVAQNTPHEQHPHSAEHRVADSRCTVVPSRDDVRATPPPCASAIWRTIARPRPLPS